MSGSVPEVSKFRSEKPHLVIMRCAVHNKVIYAYTDDTDESITIMKDHHEKLQAGVNIRTEKYTKFMDVDPEDIIFDIYDKRI